MVNSRACTVVMYGIMKFRLGLTLNLLLTFCTSKNIANPYGGDLGNQNLARDTGFARSNKRPIYFEQPVQYHRCNYVIHDQRFMLSSRLFPTHYDSNINCAYYVHRLRGMCAVEIIFKDFSLEYSENCLNDWIQIGNLKYCGRVKPKPIYVPFDNKGFVYINFHTNGVFNDRGFVFFARQLPCDWTLPSHGDHRPKPIIEQPHYHRPPKPPHCHHHPCPPKPCATTQPPRPTYTTTIVPPPTPTTTLPSTTAATTSCVREFVSPEGSFESPDYPFPYANNLECEYRFVRLPGYCSVSIYFNDFLLEESENCSKDFLISNGNRYCGIELYGTTLELSFSFRSTLTMAFITDAWESGRGFSGLYRQILCEAPPFSTTTLPTTTSTVSTTTTLPPFTCDRELEGPESFLKSVNHPSYYLPNLQCEYTVRKHSPNMVFLEIYFIFFELQVSTDCRADYLEVGGRKYCGEQTGVIFTIPFPGNTETLRFHSDGSLEYTGFSIRLRQLQTPPTPVPSTTPSPTGCPTRVFNESSFIFTSPQYPSPYNPSQECRYIIQRTSKKVCEIEFRFIQFQLPVTPGCSGDHLKIDSEAQKICGLQAGRSLVFDITSDSMEVVFFADSEDEMGLGFMIQVQQVELGCETFTVPPSFLQVGPPRSDIAPVLAEPLKAKESETVVDDISGVVEHKLEHSPSQGSQLVRVHNYRFLQKPGYCGLQLHFKNFYVTPSANCTKSFLSIDGRRFCGQQLNAATVDVAYTLGKEDILIPYEVGSVAKSVWSMSYNQIKCSKDLRPQCSQAVWSPTGSLHFDKSNFKNFENRTISCDFIVRRWSRKVCRLEMHLEKFDLAEEKACNDTYVDIEGHKMCGSLDGRTTQMSFPTNSESLRFPLRLKIDEKMPASIKINIKQNACR